MITKTLYVLLLIERSRREPVQYTQGMPNFAFDPTVRVPPAAPLSAPAVDKGEGAGEAVAALPPEVCVPVGWVLAVDVGDDVRPAGTSVTVEPSSTST